MPEPLSEVAGKYQGAGNYTLCFVDVEIREDEGMRYVGREMRAEYSQKRQSEQAESLIGRPGGQLESSGQHECLEDARDGVCSVVV